MARASILDRFRPLGAPGPAGPLGVASADELGVAAELAAVFAALAVDVEACRDLVDEARLQEEANAAAAALSEAGEARLPATVRWVIDSLLADQLNARP